MLTSPRRRRPFRTTRTRKKANATAPTEKVPGAVIRTMRLSVLEGGVTQTFLNWASGSVLVGYMMHVGASPTDIGLVSSVPLLAQVTSPFAAYFAALVGRRKGLTAALATVGRGLWLLAAFLPLLGVPVGVQPAFLVALVMVSSLFGASAGTLWTDWMGDVVPEGKRGRYFGFRAGLVGVVGMLANLGAGWFLDRMAAPLNFQIVIGVSVLCALLGIVLYLFPYEPPVAKTPVSLRATFSAPWNDPNFRRFLSFSVYWQASVLLAAPFVIPYFLGELKMSFTQIALWSSIASSCALLTTTGWGWVADHVGNKAVLAIGTYLAGAALPACWILAGLTGNLTFIWLSAVFDALAWGAIGPALFNLALASAPKANRAAFIAMFSLATGVAGFVSGLLSGPLLSVLLGFWPSNGGWTGFHALFALSGFLRIQAWRLLRPIQETNAWRTRDVLRELRYGWRRTGFSWRS